MKTLATLWRSARWLAAIAMSLLLIACGGGGGGGGGSGNSDDGFTISASSLSFSAQQFGSLPSVQDIQASFTHPEAYYMGAAYPPGVTPVTWLDIQMTGSGNTWTFHFSVNTTGLSPGTYTTTIGLGIARSNGSIIAYKNVDVSYTVVPKLTASPTSLNFAFVIGGTAPASQGVTIGGTGATWTASANQPWVILNSTGGTAPGVLGVGVDTNLAPGAYNATIQISDGITPLSVPVTYTVRAPNISVDPGQLNLTGINGAPSPPASNVSVSSETGIPVSYTTNVVYTGASGWLSVPSNGTAPGTLAIGHSTNVAPGFYSAEVILTPSNGAPTRSMRVNYVVSASSLTLSPTSASFSINANSTTADADIKRTIIVSQTGSVLNWTAASSVPWLTVSPASGTNYGTVTLTLVPAQLVALENGQHTATVTFTYSGPYVSNQTASLPVILNLNAPIVNYVSPYVALTNTSKQVIIRGSGFNSINGQQLLFGSNTVSNFTVVSDTEIRATHPVLTAGNHSVKITNQLGITRSRADLIVVDPVQYGYEVLPTSLYAVGVIYDAERKAVYVGRNYYPSISDRIERFRYTAGGWVVDALPIADLRDVELTPDGKELIAVSKDQLFHIDPVSLTISSKISLVTLPYPFSIMNFEGLTIGNDGVALVHLSLYETVKYNVLTKSLSLVYLTTPSSLICARSAASGDGSRIILGQNCVSPEQPMYYYDVSTGQAYPTGYSLSVGRVTLDRTGNRSNVDGAIYDRQFNLEGNILNATSIISSDGSKAYGYMFPPYTGAAGTLHIHNLNSRNSTGGFNEIGSGIDLQDYPGIGVNMATSPDEKNLFITGEEKFIVMPLP